jgi:hypothetical protein
MLCCDDPQYEQHYLFNAGKISFQYSMSTLLKVVDDEECGVKSLDINFDLSMIEKRMSLRSIDDQ